MLLMLNNKASGDTAPTLAEVLAVANTAEVHDFTDTSTMWQDTAQTTAVTSTNDPVASVEDLTTNGRDLEQSTPADRPTYDGEGLLGNGSNQFITNDWGSAESQPVTTTLSFKYLGVANSVFIMDGTRNPNRHIFGVQSTNDNWGISAGNALVGWSTDYDANDHVVTIEFNGASSKVWFDGVLVFDAGDGDAGPDAMIGYTLLAAFSAGSNANARIYRLISNTGQVSDADRAIYEGWADVKGVI